MAATTGYHTDDLDDILEISFSSSFSGAHFTTGLSVTTSQNKTSGFDKRVTLMHSLLLWVTGGSRFLPTLNLDPLILGFHFAALFSVAVVSPHALMLALKAAKAAAPNSYSSFLAPGPCFRFIRFAVLLVP